MKYLKLLHAAAFAAAFSGLPTTSGAYEYSYGEIPIRTVLCSGSKTDIGMEAHAGGVFNVEGEAGVGVTFIGKAKITAKAEPGVSVGGFTASTASLQMQNCIELANTKSELSFGRLEALEDRLPAAEFFLLQGLLTDPETGETLSENDLALELIESATAFNSTMTSSRAGLESFGIVSDAFTDAITGTNPLDIQNSINTVSDLAESASGLIPPKLYNAMKDPEMVLRNHLSQIDFISSSCSDLQSGEIEHLTEVMIDAIADACLLVADTQEVLESFVDGTVAVAERGAEAAEEIGEILTDGQTVAAVTKSIDDSAREIDETIDQIEKSIDELDEAIDSGEKFLKGAVNAGENIVKGSFDSIASTTEEIGATLAGAGSSSSNGVQLLQGEVDRTLELIRSLSVGNIAQAPLKIADEAAKAAAKAVEDVANEICDIGIGFGAKVSDVPGVSNILGC